MQVPEADVYLVGLGMVELRQLTLETVEVLRGVRAIYHFSDRHEALREFGVAVHDLRSMYGRAGTSGADVYQVIAEFLVDRARLERPIAIAMEGNPMLYSTVSWRVAALGAGAGLRVEAVAAVSCLDVLPVQLGFDPGDLGMQVMEATALVRYGLRMNPYLSTLLLQVGHFAAAPGVVPPLRQKDVYTPLIEHLGQYYPADHPAVFCESAGSAGAGTVTLITEVGRISEMAHEIRPQMTLYLPRIGMPAVARADIDQS